MILSVRSLKWAQYIDFVINKVKPNLSFKILYDVVWIFDNTFLFW